VCVTVPIYTSIIGNNDTLLETISKLYFKPDDLIADVTYGKGVFWKKIDLTQYNFYPSDLITCKETPYDFKKLPYEKNKFDSVVFDPPYMHTVGRPIVDGNYQNSNTTKNMYHTDIINLYYEGMLEAKRVLKSGGFMLVKCQDEIESSYQRWSHIDIYNIATKLKLYGKDLFVLTRYSNPPIQYKQQHARKKHSYMWVFQKVEAKKFGLLKKKQVINTIIN